MTALDDNMPMPSTTPNVPADLGPAHRIVEESSPVTSSAIIPLLQRLQDAYGYLPREVILEVCRRTGLPASRVFGVATFYAQFHLAPRARHIVRCCRGTACHVKGGKRVAQALRRELGVAEGGSTEDWRFTYETVACLGTCFLAPVVMVDGDYYGDMTADRAKRILEPYK